MSENENIEANVVENDGATVDNDKKLNAKNIVKKWWFWVIIVAVVIIIIVAICVGANRSTSDVISGADGPSESVTDSLEEEKPKDNKGEVSVIPEYEEYINNMPNKPVNDNQKKALNYAMDYYKYSNMTYNSIVTQLEADGFSHEDAVYAADNCGADWQQVAVKAAINYMEFEPQSKATLCQKLQYDGFSEQEAIYAVDNAGIDYSDAARRVAQDFLSYENYDKASLVKILVENEFFTQEEANKGVDLALASR